MKYLEIFKKNYKITAVIFIVLILSFVFIKKDKNQKTDTSQTTVKRQDLTQRVTISGVLWPKKRLDIKPPFNGYIEKIFVKIGDKVKVGTPLITFSPSLGKGETNFPVRSAFDGVVSQIIKTEGEYVTESGNQNLILRVEDVSDLYVLAAVPELDIAKVKIGQEATVRVSSLLGETFTGSISEISLSAQEKDQNGMSNSNTEFQVRIHLNSHDPRLLPGMSALMDILTNKATSVLTLPHEYVQEENGKYYVTTTNAEKKPVEVGLQTESDVEIKSGLNEGDKVKIVDFLNTPLNE